MLSFGLPQYVHAQNWQTVPANDTNWFVINNTPLLEEGQLRVIWLDSTNTNGNFLEGFFCRALRPLNDNCFDTLGSSWMGKRYIHNVVNGDEYFFNLLGDTSLIKTHAQVSDSWLMSSDSLGIEFQASVYAVNMMIVDDVLDSIKYITIQAYQGVVPIQHECNDTLILSKNHGFIRTPEWYSFPYEIPWSWTTYRHRSFSIGQNRLSRTKVMASLNEIKSKYTAGNEWITEYTQSPFTKTITHDSIVSVIDTSIGYRVNFERKQKVIDLVTLAQTNTISMMSELKDTTSYFANSIYQLLPEYMGFEFYTGFPTFLNSYVGFLPTKYTISNACNGTIKVEKDLSGYALNVHDVGGCYVGSVPLGDPPILILTEEQVLGRRMLIESIGSIFPLDTFRHLYYNINGCLLGAKISFTVAADAFDLQATLHNQNQVNVNWQTTNEHHVARFDIERKTPSTDFKTITSMQSHGDNPNQNEYSYTDQLTFDLLGENFQYRIKMVDLDGKVQYSNTVSVNTKKLYEVSIFPNPFQHNAIISGLVPTEEYVIELTNLVGLPLIKSSYSSDLKGNINLAKFNELPNGIYFVRISNAEGLAYSSKLVKSK
jgi:hypothetical protein